jgi:hypothetical protein
MPTCLLTHSFIYLFASSFINFSSFTFFITSDMIEFDTEFVEEVVLSLSRLDSSSIALAAFKMHRKWILEEKIKPFNPKFGTCFTVFFVPCVSDDFALYIKAPFFIDDHYFNSAPPLSITERAQLSF